MTVTPNRKQTNTRLQTRPAAQKGLTIPEQFPEKEHMEAFFNATTGVGTLHDA